MEARYDHRTPRLFLEDPLCDGAQIALDRDKAHYLVSVMRLKAGDGVLVFNGRDGEFRAVLEAADRKAARLAIGPQTRPQPQRARVTLAFAPLRHARLDYMVQKAVEMGAGRLMPVFTHHTQPNRINTERMQANVLEAAEQCGILTIAEVLEPKKLDAFLAGAAARDPLPLIVFCDEGEEAQSPFAALDGVAPDREVVVLIGPEGGFSIDERRAIRALGHARAVTLGPRILRADTAAVAALALVGAALDERK